MNVPVAAPDMFSELSSRELRTSILQRWVLRTSTLLGWAAFIGVWYAISLLVLDTRRLPPLHVIIGDAWSVITEQEFRSNLQSSFLRVLTGFILALLISAALGWLIAYNTWWRTLLTTLFEFIVSTPIVSLAILTLVVFGVSSIGPILMTALAATPYIMMNVAQGLAGADQKLIVMSESFSRTRPQIIRGVLLPSSMLSVLGGTRLAFAVAWRMELLTEVFAASSGMGYQIRRSFESYDIRGMLAWSLLFIVVMLLFENLVFRQIENRIHGRGLRQRTTV